MSTIHDFENLEDGWSLVSHFISNQILAIRLIMQNVEYGKEAKEKQERCISDIQAQLAGKLYMIVFRMQAIGCEEVAMKVKQILDMVVGQEFSGGSILDAILEKNNELNPNKKAFDEALAAFRKK